MMVVDLLTIYIVVLLNATTLTIIWFAIWRSYPGFHAARIWTFSAGNLALGGVVLLAAEPLRSQTLTIGGNAVILLGYCLSWVGVCRFLGRREPWRETAALIIVSVALLYLFQENRTARNLIYAVGQSLPLLFAIVELRRGGRPAAGFAMASWGMTSNIAARFTCFGAVAANANGAATFETYSAVYTAGILAQIFTAMVWNFGYVMMAIDRLRGELLDMALVDELTGLANRRAFQERGSAALVQSVTTGDPLALLVVDLDNFKQINDEYGHAAGDASLGHFARHAASRLPSQALLARTGGDEFCLLLPGMDIEGAAATAEILVASFRSAPLAWRGQAIQLTISIGLAAVPAPGIADIGGLIDRADGALYDAKRRGRDRYAAAQLEEPGPAEILD
ncbi:GGDEF domain-containing protein [Kaistia algarum]|uniref:GGDEF domain-containing protein n=1 Tax=Kaistia algarum TaxID=2083279 RepID=UPI00140360AE|nr:GGDEF domain-containing protein [Kaistia algarum]MCX5512390.1 GGDEF domain-containing protein [Kaistia algarum]